MQIVPFVGDTPIQTTTFSIRVDPADKQRVETLTARASEIGIVNDSQSFAIAKHTAGQIKALLDEIEDARKASQRPQIALKNAIDELAQNIAAPLHNEQKRVLGLLNGYVTRLEAEEKAEARRREDALKAKLAEQERKVREAQEAQKQAQAEARKAQDEATRLRLREEALRRQEAAEDAQLAQELALEAAKIGKDTPAKAKVPGGRVDHVYEFELTNIQLLIKEGGWRLVRWELDKRACMDSVRAQLEIDKDTEPTLPGIRITRRVNVSVRATL